MGEWYAQGLALLSRSAPFQSPVFGGMRSSISRVRGVSNQILSVGPIVVLFRLLFLFPGEGTPLQFPFEQSFQSFSSLISHRWLGLFFSAKEIFQGLKKRCSSE